MWNTDTDARKKISKAIHAAKKDGACEFLRDASTIHWTLSAENEGDPRLMLADIIRQCVIESLDPVISQQAAEMVAAARQQGYEQAREHVKALADENWFLFEDMESVYRFKKAMDTMIPEPSADDPAA